MSTYARASAVNGSNRLEGRRTEGADEESSSSRTNTPCLKAVRPKLRTADPAGEGRSNGLEPLARPALPGRKVHKKTCCKDSRGRRREGHRDEEEVRLRAEYGTGRERGTQRLGKTERTETHGAAGGRGSSESLSSSNSDVQLSSTLEAGEGSSSFLKPHGYSSTSRASLKPPPPPPTARSRCSALAQPPIQTRSAPLAPQRPPPRTSIEEQHRRAFSATRGPDPFWVEVRSRGGPEASSQSRHQTRISSLTSLELGGGEEEEEEEQVVEEDEALEGDEEEGGGVMVMRNQTVTSASVPPCVPFAESGISKRERNRIKCLRRRQRRRERWRQSQLQEGRQSSPGIPSSSSSGSEDDEDLSAGDREGYICAVCLDVYFSPYMCHPCNHVFCEPCLRTLAKNSPTNTPCPLCRTIITHVFFQKELNQSARTFFPNEYLSRKQNFQKASCAKWPLPSCRKLFRIFGGFQRQSSPVARRQIPHGGRYRLDAMDFRDDARGWRLDMVIIYIFSVNWVIGFFILCFICYLFFPSL